MAYVKTKEQQRIWNKRYYENNKEREKARTKAYRDKNREKALECGRISYAKHRDKYIKNGNNYRKARRINDPVFRLQCNMRSAVRRVLTSKASGSYRHLPFSNQELFDHLQSLFKPGMSWDNMSEWEVDHIIPLRYKNDDGTFYWNQEDMANPKSEAFKKAWSLSNLQPLWTSENASKQNRYIG